MESGYSYILFFLLGVVILAFLLISNERKRKTHMKRSIKKSWGIPSKREYTPEQMKIAAGFYRQKKYQGFQIDNITWNDLDMDRMFQFINTTFSSPGEEYLYYMLRTPETSKETLLEREKLISYYKDHPKEREQLQYLFADLGKSKKISVVDYLYRLHDMEERSNVRHILLDLALLAALLLMFLLPIIGAPLFIVLLTNNILQYFRIKGQIGSYFTSVTYLISLLRSIVKLQTIKTEVVQPYIKELKELEKVLHPFLRGSFWVTDSGNTSGDILAIILDYVRMVFHLDLIKFNSMIRELKQHISDMERMIELYGILECVIVIGSFRTALPYYCTPQLKEEGIKEYRVSSLFHPLVTEPVPNSLITKQNVLLTGSNASGKSTFLKAAAINSILAQTIYTCPAKEYIANFYQIYTSMALKDDLAAKESYFIVEIKSLKRILDHKNDDLPVLCFIDEVLRGTNTVERISASSQILKSLTNDQCLCFAATHDIELTYLLEEYYSNYHFEEEFTEYDIYFPYKIKTGRARSRNAIKLLSIIGYENRIIKEAEHTASVFMESGEWRL